MPCWSLNVRTRTIVCNASGIKTTMLYTTGISLKVISRWWRSSAQKMHAVNAE